MIAGASGPLQQLWRSAIVQCGFPLFAHSLLTFVAVMSARSAFSLPFALAVGLSASATAVLVSVALLRNRANKTPLVRAGQRSRCLQTAPIAHELRTKLAIITLQLNKMQDPRARAIEQDLKDLTENVDRFSVMVQNPSAAIPDCS